VDATLPFRLIWLGDLFAEGATLLFFLRDRLQIQTHT